MLLIIILAVVAAVILLIVIGASKYRPGSECHFCGTFVSQEDLKDCKYEIEPRRTSRGDGTFTLAQDTLIYKCPKCEGEIEWVDLKK